MLADSSQGEISTLYPSRVLFKWPILIWSVRLRITVAAKCSDVSLEDSTVDLKRNGGLNDR